MIMKYICLSLPLFAVFLFTNCGSNSDVDFHEIPNTIEIHKSGLVGDATTFQFEPIDTIQLDAPGNPAITSIQDISFGKDFFLIVDVKQGLLKFDNQGNFLQKIGAKGEGPDEYDVTPAIYLDEKEKVILVADWGKMLVIAFNLQGDIIGTSKKLPGRPVSFYLEQDELLVIQEGTSSDRANQQTVLVSSINPQTLEHKGQETPLYNFMSPLNRIHSFLRPFGNFKEGSLFYFPRERFEGLTEHQDTIYRKSQDALVPEYLLHFKGFNMADTLHLSYMEIVDDHASILFRYKKKPYIIVLDLANNVPMSYQNQLFLKELVRIDYEGFPKHLKEDIYYSIIRDEESDEEKNPSIVFSKLTEPN